MNDGILCDYKICFGLMQIKIITFLLKYMDDFEEHKRKRILIFGRFINIDSLKVFNCQMIKEFDIHDNEEAECLNLIIK